MSHGYSLLNALSDYEKCCSEFSEKCSNVLNGNVKAYYTRYKVTDSFWILAAFYKKGDAYLICRIWRGSYKGVSQGRSIGDLPLSEAVKVFPELKRAEWFDHWQPTESLNII